MTIPSSIATNSLHAWWLALRPKTLSAALAPVGLAAALAWRHGLFQWQPLLLCAVFAGLMQIASNFINDLFDHLKGRDTAERLGPERTCAQGWITPHAMRWGIAVVVAAACVVGLCLIPYGGWGLVVIGVCCVGFAFLYTTCLAQQGWGDVLVLIFFGVVPVVTTYYLLQPSKCPPASVWGVGLAIGFMVDALLVVNNYRDRQTDAAVGKRTLIVRCGERWGERLYALIGAVAIVLMALCFVGEQMPYALPLLLAPLALHWRAYRQLCAIGHGRALNQLLATTSQVILAFALVGIISFCIL